MYNRTLRMRALRLLRLLIIATAILYVFSPPGPAKYLTPAFADTPHAVDACRDRNLNIVPCGEDSRTGSYAASDRCGASCQHPNVSCGCASCAPDAGYAWVGSGGHDYRVRWAPEIRHPDYPHITAGDTTMGIYSPETAWTSAGIRVSRPDRIRTSSQRTPKANGVRKMVMHGQIPETLRA
jgi:hypothetical protein